MKDNRAIGHIKEYYQRFKKSTVHTEGYLSLVARLNVNIIEFPANIHLSEVIGSLEFGDQFKNQREQILVFDGYCIESSIVLHQLKKTILFLNEKD